MCWSTNYCASNVKKIVPLLRGGRLRWWCTRLDKTGILMSCGGSFSFIYFLLTVLVPSEATHASPLAVAEVGILVMVVQLVVGMVEDVEWGNDSIL